MPVYRRLIQIWLAGAIGEPCKIQNASRADVSQLECLSGTLLAVEATRMRKFFYRSRMLWLTPPVAQQTCCCVCCTTYTSPLGSH